MTQNRTGKSVVDKKNTSKSVIGITKDKKPKHHTESGIEQIDTEKKQTEKGRGETNAQIISPSEAHKQSEIITNAIIIAAEKISQKRDFVSWWSVFINAGLLVITVFLFIYNKKGIDQAVISSKSNDSTSKANLEATKAFYKAQESDFDAKNKFNSDALATQQAFSIKNDKNSKKAIDAQISSIKETQKEFEKEHEPYLEIRNLSDFNLVDGDNIRFNYEMLNVGKSPVKEMYGRESIDYVLKSDSIKYFKNPFIKITNYEPVFNYIGDENKIKCIFFSGLKFPPGFRNMWENGNLLLYFTGRRFYRNLVTNKNAYYEFVIEIFYKKKDEYYFATVINNNVVIN